MKIRLALFALALLCANTALAEQKMFIFSLYSGQREGLVTTPPMIEKLLKNGWTVISTCMSTGSNGRNSYLVVVLEMPPTKD